MIHRTKGHNNTVGEYAGKMVTGDNKATEAELLIKNQNHVLPLGPHRNRAACVRGMML